MDNAGTIPLSTKARTVPAITEIVRATRAACRDLVGPHNDEGTSLGPDATHTVLAMIRLWGVPVVDTADVDPERTWLWSDLHLRDTASVRHGGSGSIERLPPRRFAAKSRWLSRQTNPTTTGSR